MPRRRRKPSGGLDHRAYRKARDKLRSESQVCHICGQAIDLKLSAENPYHRMAWTADHLTPRSKGGHLLGPMKAAHRACNSSRGNRDTKKVDQLPTTRMWLKLDQ